MFLFSSIFNRVHCSFKKAGEWSFSLSPGAKSILGTSLKIYLDLCSQLKLTQNLSCVRLEVLLVLKL